jgi:hypothetical protein
MLILLMESAQKDPTWANKRLANHAYRINRFVILQSPVENLPSTTDVVPCCK